MDREMLDNLLKTKYGEDFDTSLITDEDISGLTPKDDDEDIDDDDNSNEQTLDNTNYTNEDIDDDDVDLENINVEELSEDAKLLYKLIIKEKQARLSDKIDNIIISADLSDAQKKVVRKFAKASNDLNDIKDMVADLEKDNKASKRVIGNSRVIGKNNVKSTIKVEKNNKTPKFGTKEFGAWLAKKK